MPGQPQLKDLVGYSFLVAFANDHVFDAKELMILEALATGSLRANLVTVN